MDEKLVDHNDKVSKWFSNKTFILSLLFIFGIVVLVLLYVNFKFTYQFSGINQQIAELDSNQLELKSVSEQLLSSKNQLYNPIDPSKAALPTVVTQQGQPCQALLHFTQDYYQMRMQAELGKNFSSKLLELNEYVVSIAEITNNLSALTSLSSKNIEDIYLVEEFNKLVRNLYINEYSNSLWRNYLKKLIFIKPIGERAIEKGGMDKEIILAEYAFAQKNFVDANTHLENLSKYLEADDLKKLQEIQLALQNKLAIKEAFINLDRLLAKQYNCSIVVSK